MTIKQLQEERKRRKKEKEVAKSRPKRQLALGIAAFSTLILGGIALLFPSSSVHVISETNKKLEEMHHLSNTSFEVEQKLEEITKEVLKEMKDVNNKIMMVQRNQVIQQFTLEFRRRGEELGKILESPTVSPSSYASLFGINLSPKETKYFEKEPCSYTEKHEALPMILSLTIAQPVINQNQEIFELWPLIVYKKEDKGFCPYQYPGPKHLIFDKQQKCSALLKEEDFKYSDSPKTAYIFSFKCNEFSSFAKWKRAGPCRKFRTQDMVQPFYLKDMVQLYCFGYEVSIQDKPAFPCPNAILNIPIRLKIRIIDHPYHHNYVKIHNALRIDHPVYHWIENVLFRKMEQRAGHNISNLEDVLSQEEHEIASFQPISINLDKSNFWKGLHWLWELPWSKILQGAYVLVIIVAALFIISLISYILFRICSCGCWLVKLCKRTANSDPLPRVHMVSTYFIPATPPPSRTRI